MSEQERVATQARKRIPAEESPAKSALQRATITSEAVTSVPPIVHEVLSSPGQPLDVGTRAFMEPRFGYDFSGVRVHTGTRAAQSAEAVNARAYTVGRDMVFGEGEYAPGTSEGRGLLAHELTHVVQQSQISAIARHPIISIATTTSELEAQSIAHKILHSEKPAAESLTRAEPALARAPVPDEYERPRFEREVDDIVADIQQRRKAVFERLAQEYKLDLLTRVGISSIASTEDAIRVLRLLGIDMHKMDRELEKIEKQLANQPSKNDDTKKLKQDEQKEKHQLTPKGQRIFNRVLQRVREEPFFRKLETLERIFIQPDPAICQLAKGRWRGGYTRPIEKENKPVASIVHLCQNMFEMGGEEEAIGTLSHELSHVAREFYMGTSSAEIVTSPVIEDLIQQLIKLSKYEKREDLVRQYLYQMRGGYPLEEIFAKLQQIPQTPAKLKNDLVLKEVYCLLGRVDASTLPKSIREELIRDLKVQTEIFYDARIREISSVNAGQLEQMKKHALKVLDIAIRTRGLGKEGAEWLNVKCNE